ncbi:MAG: hypothetical protein JO270_17565 [Acidobacteriaceae bacterium]|nr:hypothetical protein [Acidobacteriaceae bacterium]MBV8569342.1 hypothetical protein [Acidobacteriaceae bacterium]
MDIIGERKFVEVPGEKTHELPPLLVKTVPDVKRMDKLMCIASEIIDQEDMVAPVPEDLFAGEDAVERRKMDLALNLVDQYLGLLSHWHWGDAVIEWIRQCEITFGMRVELRSLLRSDLWPHAGRSSFVTLLEDKEVSTPGVQLERAVGLRLAFRQMPPIRCCSDQFLFYLNRSVAQTAYRTWFEMTPSPVSSLPPERFRFEIVNLSLDVH